MKRVIRSLLVLTVVLALTLLAAGCGKQTDEANKLVDEVNVIASEVEPKLDQADKLLVQATDQLAQGKTADEQASLTQAQKNIDEILGKIETARTKTDEAAALDISDAYRQYLQAKGRALEEALGLTQTSREITVLLLADPTVEKPDTLAKVTDLEGKATAQADRLKEAEDEASQVAADHSEEIQQ